MKRASLAIISALVLAGPAAHAADLALKAPPPAAVVSSWTGFYLGVDAGGAWSNGSSSTTPLPDTIGWNRLPDTFNLRASSAIGGVHAGYNLQVAPNALIGIEADWQATNTGASSTVQDRDSTGTPFPVPLPTTMTRDLHWLASVRPRAGIVANNSLLLFVTGGAAWGEVHYTGTLTSLPPGFTWAANTSATRSGYVVGGGAEWMLMPNLLLRAQYLFYRLQGDSVIANGVPPLPPFQIGYNWNAFNTNVVEVGLSYKFGGSR